VIEGRVRDDRHPVEEHSPDHAPRPVPRPRFFLAIVLVAVLAALFATAFRASIEAIFRGLFHAENVLVAFSRLPLPTRIALPALGGFVAGAASAIAARMREGQGVGDVMEAVVLGGRRMSIRATLWKAAGSWSAIVSGGSLGREGPIIQFGGVLGARIGESFRISDARRRALIAAGTAAGFAAAYNTPIAAVLFVVEVVIGVVALRVLLPTMVAAAIATAITRFAVGPGPIYGQQPFTMRSNGELAAHLMLGVVAGLAGVGFMRVLAISEKTFSRIPLPRPARAALGGALVGVIACALPQVTGNGYEAIALLLGGKFVLGMMVILLFAKIIATSASVGSGSPGGVFTPSLFIGAALGAALASSIQHFAPSLPLGAVGGYALVGMAAVVAATTHAPLMSAALVFELSGDYAIVLPLLIATSAATAVARKLHPSSIYMEELERRGVRWEVTLSGREVQRRPDA